MYNLLKLIFQNIKAPREAFAQASLPYDTKSPPPAPIDSTQHVAPPLS